MLRHLSIRNIVLIRALDLEFTPGLNVMTGETGAGKSILMDALGYALGRQVRRDLVRGYITPEVAARDYGLTEDEIAEVAASVRAGTAE